MTVEQLVQVEHEAHWRAYHFIRRHVLYELRGRVDYDEGHPDEQAEGHMPLLFLWDGQPVGVARLDQERDTGTVRMVAVLPVHQRQGIGTAMMHALERFAEGRGIRHLHVHAAYDAAAFYEKLGWTTIDANKRNPLMSKAIT